MRPAPIAQLTRGQPWLVAFFAALSALALAWLLWLSYVHFTQAVNPPQRTTFVIAKGTPFNRTVTDLADAGLLHRPFLFKWYGRMRGDANQMQAGTFVFEHALSPAELMDTLLQGRTELVVLTVPEGRNLAEIAQLVAEQEMGSAAEFVRLAQDASFIAELDVGIDHPGTSLEGFLFPETYYMNAEWREAEVIQFMVRQFKEKAAPVLRKGQAPGGLSPYEALVLASIVEKETGVPAERPRISAVFHNRLKIDMRLQTDPTVIYGVTNFDGNLTRRHLRTPTPYNTYTNKGLTPTPITNPGLHAIQAALRPGTSDELYFVAKGDGTHYFSKTYAEHKLAVRRYQLGR